MHCGPGGQTVVADLDGEHVERVEQQIDVGAGEQRIDLVGVAMQRDRGDLGDFAALRPQERLAQQPGPGESGGRPGGEPFDRCLPGLGVDSPVIHLLDPGGEQPVEFIEPADIMAAADRV